MSIQNERSVSKWPFTFYAAVCLLAAWTLFYNLGDRLLWSDEAESALLAVNITQYGIPRTVDGRNHLTLHGADVDGNAQQVWVWSPWADEYLAALSFLVFEPSTVSARLPFAGIGLLSVVLLGRLTYRLFESHASAVTAMLLYATNVAFLLHARQCRYYALLMAAQIVLVSGYFDLSQRRGRIGSVQVMAALALQFYCNYIVIVGNVLALVAAALVGRRGRRGLMSWAAASLLGAGSLAVPWLLYAQPAAGQAQEIGRQSWGATLWYYLSELNLHVLPVIVLLIPAIAYLFRLLRGRRPESAPAAVSGPSADSMHTLTFCWLMLPCHLALVSLLPLPFFRYVTPLIPVLMLLAAWILTMQVRVFWVRYALVAVLCLSNVLGAIVTLPMSGWRTIGMPYLQFVRGIVTPYRDRTEDLVAYVQQHAGPDDTILVMDPEFPLIFYTGRRIVDARLTDNIERATDWVLTESGSGTDTYDPLLPPTAVSDRYDEVRIPVLKTRRGASRPDPHFHEHFTAPQSTELVAYRLRDGSSSQEAQKSHRDRR